MGDTSSAAALISEERPLAARASRRQGTPPKKRTAARRQDDTGGPFAPRGRCSLHDEATPIGTPTGSRYRQMRMPGSAPDPGQEVGLLPRPSPLLGQPGDCSTLSSRATSQHPLSPEIMSYNVLSSIHVCSGHTAAPATPLGRLRSWRAATREKTQCTASPEACRSPPSASPLGARQLHLGLARPRGVFARKQGEASRELRSRGAGCLRAGGSVVKEPAGHPSERKRVARGQV